MHTSRASVIKPALDPHQATIMELLLTLAAFFGLQALIVTLLFIARHFAREAEAVDTDFASREEPQIEDSVRQAA